MSITKWLRENAHLFTCKEDLVDACVAATGRSKKNIQTSFSDTQRTPEPISFSKPGEYTSTFVGNVINVSGEFNNLDDMVKRCNIDLSIWECYDFKVMEGEWDVSSKYRDQDLKWKKGILNGHAIRKNKWIVNKNKKQSIEAKFRLKPTVIHKDTFKKDLMEDIYALEKVKPILYNINSNKETFSLEICRFDLHYGKQIWGDETGGNHYDTKIAKELYAESRNYLINNAKKICGIDKILLPIGNDFFNADNNLPIPSTTKGTPMQEDLRWQKTFRNGRMIIAEDIVQCKQVAPVDVYVIPGNHDFQKSFYLGDAIECLFENDKQVHVDNSANPHKYWAYGNSLIGFVHNTDSMPRLATTMQYDVPQLWADARFREWHLGDIHHMKKLEIMTAQDIQAITVRYLRTLMPTEGWENEKLYRSNKGAHAFIWSKTNGLFCELQFNL